MYIVTRLPALSGLTMQRYGKKQYREIAQSGHSAYHICGIRRRFFFHLIYNTLLQRDICWLILHKNFAVSD
jgi:hypothetical protein